MFEEYRGTASLKDICQSAIDVVDGRTYGRAQLLFELCTTIDVVVTIVDHLRGFEKFSCVIRRCLIEDISRMFSTLKLLFLSSEARFKRLKFDAACVPVNGNKQC
jgi:hypothetical protein